MIRTMLIIQYNQMVFRILETKEVNDLKMQSGIRAFPPSILAGTIQYKSHTV
jgi:hypothetical protein